MKNTILLKVSAKNPEREKIKFCADVLRSGGLVAFPTETVYGLAANREDRRAINDLYKVKRRPKGKPFTVHIADMGDVKKLGCVITKEARALMLEFWPGPLTIILKSRNGKRIGFRMPDHKVALELIRMVALPVVAPSANPSGEVAPNSAKGVIKGLGGKVDVILDAGRTKVGVESTVIDMTKTPPKILRKGALSKERIMKVLARIS